MSTTRQVEMLFPPPMTLDVTATGWKTLIAIVEQYSGELHNESGGEGMRKESLQIEKTAKLILVRPGAKRSRPILMARIFHSVKRHAAR
jgi:hypothetical protein